MAAATLAAVCAGLIHDAGAAPVAPSGRATTQASPMESLAKSLSPAGASDEDKVRAIFRWVTANIDYDPSYYTSGKAEDQTMASVLKTKKAVCFGYASLFEALAKAAGLECATIQGYSKGYRFQAGDPLSQKPNHAWNAVKVQGTWRLVDCTWGAGYLDESVQFHRFGNEHYLMTPPDQFIYDHYPIDPKWQLLARPLSRGEYEALLLVRPPFFQAGLRVMSNSAALITAGSEFSVSLGAPDDTQVLARLFRGSQQVTETCTLVQRQTGVVNVMVAPPGAGTFALRVFVKKQGQAGDYQWAAEYKVVSSATAAASSPFPQVFEAFNARQVGLTSPVRGSLTSGSPVNFRLSVPGAQSVAVVAGDEWVYLQRTGDECEGTVTPRGSALQVAALFQGKSAYEILLRYSVQ